MEVNGIGRSIGDARRSTQLPASVATGSIVLLTGCGWLRPDSCELQSTRCTGDHVQTCVPDVEATASADEPVNHWVTDTTCVDDPQLGRYACGVVAGRATCVSESEPMSDSSGGGDAGVANGQWLRVHVTREVDGGIKLAQADHLELADQTLPSDPAWGTVAAVAFSSGEIVDATLVPISPEQEAAYAWLSGDGVDQISLVDSEGVTLSTFHVAPDGSPRAFDHARGRPIGSASSVPPLRILARLGRTLSEPRPRTLELVREAFARVPEQLLLLTPTVILELDPASARSLASPDLSTPNEPDGATSTLPPDFFASSRRRVRAAWNAYRHELVLDFGSASLSEYETGTLALASDIVGALAATYVRFTDVVAERATPLAQAFGRKLPPDVPAEIEPYLYNHYARLLASGESPVSAWKSLHNLAVQAALARAYANEFGSFARSDEEAVSTGFASMDGVGSPADDLTDFAVRAAVPEAWSFGPCSALRAVPLDVVAPPLLVHAAKLIALHGLGLLRPEALTACLGELRVTQSNDPKLHAGAIILHKSDGERITFTEELEGIRQPYFSDEVQLSWKAQRAYLSASLSVGYRGTRPAVMRLQAVAGHEGRDFRSGEDHGAVLAFANPDGYQTTVALGGLLVVTDVRPDALNAFALMVALNAPLARTKILPLVSAQVATPTWGDAP